MPALHESLLEKFNSAISDQALPFQLTVSTLVGVDPFPAIAAVLEPNPVKVCLVVLRSETSVQLLPLYCSVMAVALPVVPPKANKASWSVPAPP